MIESHRVIHKYPLSLTARQTIRTYQLVTPLTVQAQGGILCLWTEEEYEDGEAKDSLMEIFIVGTGYFVPEEATVYLGTVQKANLSGMSIETNDGNL